MKRSLFFVENLYLFLLKNDSCFNTYITNSIDVYSFLIATDLLTKIELDINHKAYIGFLKFVKFKPYNGIEEYFKRIDEYLKIKEIKHTHALYFKNNKIEIDEKKLTKVGDFKIVNAEQSKKVKDDFKNVIYESSSLIKIFKKIYCDYSYKIDDKIRIIVEQRNDYKNLVNLIVKNNMKINLKIKKYLFEYEKYNEILKYLKHNDYNKEKLIKIIGINTSDYYSYCFDEFLLNLIKKLNSKEQFLFYLYYYRNFYLIKTINEDSNVSLELFDEIKSESSINYLILSTSNSYYNKEDLEYFLKKSEYILDNVRVYKHNNKIKNEFNINILKIIDNDN